MTVQPAFADLKISADPTENIACAAGTCTSTAKNAVPNVGDLAGMLAAGNIVVKSTSKAGSIEISSAVSWTSGNRLSRDSAHSIDLNKSIIVAGTGALTILTNDGSSDGDIYF